MRFELATASKIVFGDGERRRLPALVREAIGRAPVLFVTGGDTSRTAQLRSALAQEGIEPHALGIAGEPAIAEAVEGVSIARERGAIAVVAVGGGSVLDLGKAIAALMTNGGDPLDYLEVIGRGRPLERPAAPVFAVPTTAGTGSEVTKNAVLASPEQGVKASLRHDSMLPRVALVDPELTWTVPPRVTAATGLDALTQLVEPFVSPHASPVTDALCREAIPRSARSLLRAFQDGRDAGARRDLALASLFGGIALANAKLGAVHGFAGPIGGMFRAPHGAVCARLLPLVMEANVAALRARAPASPALARYAEVARLITGGADASIEDGIEWARALVQDLRIARLADYGLTPEDIPTVVERAARSSSMKGNPIELEPGELAHILERAR
ncbi:MAG: iron-containing alcohol dehydrogenase [Sandaracinaceae bacterium]|nr:iron-containing alcohol dehydrogenase [Sandaracinaceae bacterium]